MPNIKTLEKVKGLSDYAVTLEAGWFILLLVAFVAFSFWLIRKTFAHYEQSQRECEERTQRLEDRLDQSEKDHTEAMSEIRDKVASMRGAKELVDEMNKSLVSVFTEVLKAVDSNRK